MSREAILEKVIELISMVSEADEITEESDLMDDLGVSSMEIMSVVANVEDTFGIRVTESDIRRMDTVGSVVDLIEERV